jgi:steroid 5-alpha reductase family enzyme
VLTLFFSLPLIRSKDYRWAELRKFPLLAPLWTWELFALSFIAFYQLLLLTLLTLPVFVCALFDDVVPLGPWDALLSILFLAFLALETAADQQQYEFQTEKYRRRDAGVKLGGDYARGFRTSGLFRFSRHPNFFAEQTLWWIVYAFVLVATRRWWHFTAVGPTLLSMLFQGSTWFTELLTARKYPEYARYQRTTSALIPWWPKAQAAKSE